jgi:hypothetical protein
MNLLGHEPDEMSDAASRFKNATVLEPQPFKGSVHATNYFSGSIVGVESGSASSTKFVIGQKSGELFILCLPINCGTEYLRYAAPPDVSYESGFFLVGSTAILGLQLFDDANRGEICATLFLYGTFANAIGVRYSIIRGVAKSGYSVSSGARKM